jgi:hypothetical protein
MPRFGAPRKEQSKIATCPPLLHMQRMRALSGASPALLQLCFCLFDEPKFYTSLTKAGRIRLAVLLSWSRLLPGDSISTPSVSSAFPDVDTLAARCSKRYVPMYILTTVPESRAREPTAAVN